MICYIANVSVAASTTIHAILDAIVSHLGAGNEEQIKGKKEIVSFLEDKKARKLGFGYCSR